jgi:hypothetical protein
MSDNKTEKLGPVAIRYVEEQDAKIDSLKKQLSDCEDEIKCLRLVKVLNDETKKSISEIKHDAIMEAVSSTELSLKDVIVSHDFYHGYAVKTSQLIEYAEQQIGVEDE